MIRNNDAELRQKNKNKIEYTFDKNSNLQPSY